MLDPSHLDWEHAAKQQRATLPFFVYCNKGCPHWSRHKLDNSSIPCCLRRFIERRRKPKTVYSDNGTNFQGASNELHEICNMLQSSQMARVQDFLTSDGRDWKFIPPHGPHFGGLWEAAVKSMKYHLRWTLGSQITTYEELRTLLAETEACLNSRTLCALSDDPFNPTYVSWTFSNWWTLGPITCCRLY